MQVSVEQYLWYHYPQLESLPTLIKRFLVAAGKKLFHEHEINAFLEAHRQKDTFYFIEAILDYFEITTTVRTNQLARIPAYGRVVIIANHPLGALDAIALLHTLKTVRKDIKIVANAFLSSLDNLNEVIIPVNNTRNKMTKETLNSVYEALKQEQAVILFPSGEVSRVKPSGIKDTPWRSGFYKIASKMRAPILPIHIQAKNSSTFYTLSMLNKSLATATLPHEMFKYRGKSIGFNIGKVIPPESYRLPLHSDKEIIKLLRKHFYRVAKNRKTIFNTQNEIATPEERIDIKTALKEGEKLGETSDGKQIILYETDTEDVIMKEIGRLREISFRQVGEGSGRKRDIDGYDLYYKHLLIWDDEGMEIAGAYRLAEGREILQLHDTEGLYTSELFRFDPAFEATIRQGIELGRSFVQPRYWNSRALDYLWQGIGAYLRRRTSIRYLFGAVSLSEHFSPKAQAMIIYFYRRHFTASEPLVTHKDPYVYPSGMEAVCRDLFEEVPYREGLQILKAELGYMGYAIPTLFKQYADLCEEGGVAFYDFGYDRDFNSIDGFIVSDIHRIKPAKRKRYIGS